MKNLLLLAFSIMFLSCGNSQNWANRIQGEGSAVNERLELPAFHGLSNSINADISVRQGGSQSISVNAQKNIIDNLKLEVKDGILKIGFKENVGKCTTPKFDIVIPRLDYASVTGSGDIEGSGFSGSDMMKLRVTGSGNIMMDASSSTMEANITGSGDIMVKGNAQNGSIRLTGSGSFKGSEFDLKTAEVKITGSGSAKVKVADEISGNITGSGSVHGYGDPARVKLKVTGSGRYKPQS